MINSPFSQGSGTSTWPKQRQTLADGHSRQGSYIKQHQSSTVPGYLPSNPFIINRSLNRCSRIKDQDQVLHKASVLDDNFLLAPSNWAGSTLSPRLAQPSSDPATPNPLFSTTGATQQNSWDDKSFLAGLALVVWIWVKTRFILLLRQKRFHWTNNNVTISQ